MAHGYGQQCCLAKITRSIAIVYWHRSPMRAGWPIACAHMPDAPACVPPEASSHNTSHQCLRFPLGMLEWVPLTRCIVSPCPASARQRKHVAGADDAAREESSGYEANSQEASGDDEATLDEEEVSTLMPFPQ